MVSFSFGFMADEGPKEGPPEAADEAHCTLASVAAATLLRSGEPEEIGPSRLFDIGVGLPMRVRSSVNGILRVPPELDVVPGVYEGGLKVWESSVDLVRYLRHRGDIVQPTHHVLELGCGHGLPAIQALMAGARVVAADLNAEVLDQVTRCNVMHNIAALGHGAWQRLNLVSGDWLSASEMLKSLSGPYGYEVILTAETFYTVEVTDKLVRMISTHLSREGVALAAGKRFYFGTGGSSAGLIDACSHAGLKAVVAEVIEDTKSNIREVIEIRRSDDSH